MGDLAQMRKYGGKGPLRQKVQQLFCLRVLARCVECFLHGCNYVNFAARL